MIWTQTPGRSGSGPGRRDWNAADGSEAQTTADGHESQSWKVLCRCQFKIYQQKAITSSPNSKPQRPETASRKPQLVGSRTECNTTYGSSKHFLQKRYSHGYSQVFHREIAAKLMVAGRLKTKEIWKYSPSLRACV